MSVGGFLSRFLISADRYTTRDGRRTTILLNAKFPSLSRYINTSLSSVASPSRIFRVIADGFFFPSLASLISSNRPARSTSASKAHMLPNRPSGSLSLPFLEVGGMLGLANDL